MGQGETLGSAEVGGGGIKPALANVSTQISSLDRRRRHEPTSEAAANPGGV